MPKLNAVRRILIDERRVFDLKAALENLTTVPPERQKIIGLVKGKLPSDQATMFVLPSHSSEMGD